MKDIEPVAPGPEDRPEVRLELTNAEGRQVWALYSERPHEPPEVESALSRFLQDLPAIAWRWRRRVLAGAMVGAVLGVAYLLTATPVYVVRALLHIERRASVLQEYDPLRSGSTFLATQAEVIHSPQLVSDAFDAVGGVPQKAGPSLRDRVERRVRELAPWLPAGTGSARDPRDVAITTALGGLDATPLVGTDVMAVNYRTADPRRGVSFVEALIARYRDHVRNLESDAHSEGLALLRTEEQQLHRELATLQAQYDEMHAVTLALGQDEGALSVQKMRLEEHARGLVEAQGRRIELENRLALSRENGHWLPTQGSLLASELKTAQATMAELRATRSGRHPDVRNMEQQLQDLRAQQIAELDHELRAAQRTEQMLANLYEKEWADAKALETKRQREEQIRSEIARIAEKRDAVLSLLREKELQVLSLDTGRSGTVVRLLDPPTVPTSRVWPRPGMVLVSLGFVGALAGLALAIRSELRQRGSAVAAKAWSR